MSQFSATRPANLSSKSSVSYRVWLPTSLSLRTTQVQIGGQMSTKLTKPVDREVTIAGIDKPVLVSFAPSGVSARIKGSKTTLVMS